MPLPPIPVRDNDEDLPRPSPPARRNWIVPAGRFCRHFGVRMFQAIAAMSENRVIGSQGKIPWHLPEDFRWFKQATLGHLLVMGRRTFESIGRALPGRGTVILSRSGFTAPGTCTVTDLAALDSLVSADPREVFVAGGAEVYAQLLPRCSDLWLSRVKRHVAGDAFFPPFEDRFERVGTPLETADFVVEHYRQRAPTVPKDAP